MCLLKIIACTRDYLTLYYYCHKFMCCGYACIRRIYTLSIVTN